MAPLADMQHVVLVGLGHAHLYVGSRAAQFRREGLRLTLIDDGEFWYSSIGSGMLGGRYERADDVIDAEAFATRHGIDFIKGRAVSIDRTARDVVLGDGTRVPYDFLSLNVGSHVSPPFSISGDGIWSPKPISDLLQLREDLKGRFQRGDRVRWITVGGNHSGCELTLNAMALARAEGGNLDAALVSADVDLIGNEPVGARKAMRNVLEAAGCRVMCDTYVNAIEEKVLTLADSSEMPFDVAMVATGLQPSALVTACELDHNESGLIVTSYLQSPDDDRIFAVGDCASIRGYNLPKVGVFGVRASPVLTENLMARAADEPLRAYKPQKIWFAALNLGDGTGLASWGSVWWRGKSALALKDWNDRRFMELYR
ncbi:NAD(P)/FAD-dependent oxidoreductase [Ahrensia sp. R2A130]|uniref:NAD(P)/FAD-dependent oxidoreductase n=1 Tax=Ahrensia sp. R2A130 TaxID=744979 RepID=UPI0001E0BCD8|nr:FAD-dependent oxidoreductase [Ahrensia sp. R2A130]EFL87812.1 pyridine nucleotide-disulfide oxidoreductase family protein [Ahrensia sp. R2A130]